MIMQSKLESHYGLEVAISKVNNKIYLRAILAENPENKNSTSL
jgi:hypothetical protein